MRFFLDNCLAIRHARALNEMVKPEHTFTHLQDKFGPNAKDEDWIRALGREGDWIVISGDYRIGQKRSRAPGLARERVDGVFPEQRLDEHPTASTTLEAGADPGRHHRAGAKGDARIGIRRGDEWKNSAGISLTSSLGGFSFPVHVSSSFCFLYIRSWVMAEFCSNSSACISVRC